MSKLYSWSQCVLHAEEEPVGETWIKYNEMEEVLHCIQDRSSQNTVVLITNAPVTITQLRETLIENIHAEQHTYKGY